MDVKNKATRIQLFSLKTPQMRAFHMSWFAFFLCFFAWFGIAPLLPVIKAEFGMSKAQLGNTLIASVAITIFARLFIGWLCDRIGPRLCYTWLLMICSLPVMGIGFAQSYETFLLFRLGIGAIGASFVITQYHTSVMFAPNCVGTANATSAGWGNLGGGVTQMVMPLLLGGFMALNFGAFWSWRLSMVVAGAVCFLTGAAYYFFTTDLPDGNFKELRAKGELRKREKVKGTFAMACKDRRVWMLFIIYAGCFGIELTINGMAVLYFTQDFGLGLKTAGVVAGLFGLMNIFARTTGGIIGDHFGARWGLSGRVRWLFIALLVEGIALIAFSQMEVLPLAIAVMVVFSLFTQMSEGATFSVVPFINKKALGSVAGIVGAGGNAGAVAAGFLMRAETISYGQALLILGVVVVGISFTTFLISFTPEAEKTAESEHAAAVALRASTARTAKAPAWGSVTAMFKDLGVADLLRIYLGIALVVKGIFFVMHMDELESMAGGLGQFQVLASWVVVFAHSVGGAALIIGMGSRFAAGFNALVVLGAVLFVHSTEGLFGGNEELQLSLFVLFALMLIVWKGAGKVSFDRLFQDSQAKKESAT